MFFEELDARDAPRSSTDCLNFWDAVGAQIVGALKDPPKFPSILASDGARVLPSATIALEDAALRPLAYSISGWNRVDHYLFAAGVDDENTARLTLVFHSTFPLLLLVRHDFGGIRLPA
jgi:hypothetical protein